MRKLLSNITDRITELSYAVYGFLNAESEETLNSRIRQLAIPIFLTCIVLLATNRLYNQCRDCTKKVPQKKLNKKKIPQEKLEELSNVRKLLLSHRFDPEINKEGTKPLDTNFENCDREYAKLFRRLTEKMYSTGNLISNTQMMRSNATEIIENRLCKIVNQEVEIFKQEDKYGGPIQNYCQVVWEALMNLDLKSEGLSPDQAIGFTENLRINVKLITDLIHRAIHYYSLNPEWQEKSYQRIEQLASTPEVLNDVIVKMVLEALRFDDSVAPPKRGDKTVDTNKYRFDKDLVGPNAGRFDPNRLEEVPKFLPGLSYVPFGGGPNICPGWRLTLYVSVQFLTVLLSFYRIEHPDNTLFGYRHYRFVPRN